MVGHTGIMSAAIKAVDTIDECLGRLVDAIDKAGGVLLLTADHGNIELMKDQETGEPFTAHTTFDVPIIVLGAPAGAKLENGRLADIAPTVLTLMGIEKPAAMTGHSPARRRFGAKGKRLTRARKFPVLLAVLCFAVSAHGAPRETAPVTPRPRPVLKSDSVAAPDLPMDLSHALPGASLATMPSSQQQLGALKEELAKNRPRAGRRQGEKPGAGVAGGGPAPETHRHRRAHPGPGT